MKQTSTYQGFLATRRGFQHVLVVMLLCFAGVLFLPQEAWAQCDTPLTYTKQDPGCGQEAGSITITGPAGSSVRYSIDGVNYANTTGAFTDVEPATYNVTYGVIDTNGDLVCTSAPQVVTINLPPPTPATPTVVITQPTCQLATGTLQVTAPTGVAYSIDGTDYTNTTGVFTGLTEGSYSVTARNSDGCTSGIYTAVINAQPQTPPAPTATVSQQPTCTLATGTITISAPTGTGLEYNVNDGPFQTSTTFSGLDPDNYNVRVRNADGCISEPTQLTVNPQPLTPAPPTVDIIQPTCLIATATLTVSTPTGVAYSINGTDYTNTDGVFTGVAPGTYSVTARNSDGCTSGATTATVNAQPQTPPAPTATVSQQPTCTLATGTITISAPTGAGLEYNVNGGAYQSSTTFSGLEPNIYNIRVRNADGCISEPTQLTVNPQPLTPDAPVAQSPQIFCSATNPTVANLVATGNNLKWYNVATGGTALASGTALATGNYYVSQTSAEGCESARTLVSVTVNTTPAAPTAASPQIFCSATNPTVANLTATGTNLKWYNVATGGTALASGTALATGNYYVSQTSAQNCESARRLVSVTVNTTPAAPTVITPVNYCLNDPASPLTATGSNLKWYTVASGGTVLPAAPTPSTTTAGTVSYYVSQTVNGCEGPRAKIDVITNGLPVANAGADRPICSGATSTALGTSPVSGITYSWSPTTGLSNPNISNPTVTLTNTGTAPITQTYILTSTNNTTGCKNTDEVIITVNPRPQLSSTLTPAAICSGATFAYTPTSETPGATFAWTRILPTGLSGPNPSSGSGAISQTLTNNTPNPLTAIYRYTTTANTCTGTTTQDVAVVVNPNPALNSTLTPPAVCSGTPFTYTPTSATAGATFSWSRAAVTGISNPAANGTGSVTETLVNTTTAPINVTYVYTTTANGCTGAPQNVVVRVNPTPVLSSTLTPAAICSGGNFGYTPTSATTGASYAWTRAAVEGITTGAPASGVGSISGHQFVNTTTQPITVTYVYRVTANSCPGTEQNVVFTVNPSPVLNTSLDPVALCSGAAFNYSPGSATSGASFTWTRTTSTGLGSSQPPTSGTGTISNHVYTNTTNAPITITYTYRVTANGCQGPAQAIAVTINPRPQLSSSLALATICTGNTFTYTPTSNVAGATFSWSRAAVTGISNPAANGTGPISEQLVNTTSSPIDVTYQITTTANGCPGNPQNLVVRVNPYPVANFSGITDGGITYSGESPKVLTGSPAGGTFSGPGVSLAQGTWRFNACTALGTADELEVPITYTVTVGGCTSTVTKNVLVKRSTYTVINRAEPFTICRGQNVTFTAYIYREVEVIYPYTNTPITDVGIRDAATYNEAYTDYYRALIGDPDWEPSDIERAYPQRLLQPIPYNPDAGDDLEDQVDVAQFLMDPALFSYQWERNGSDQGQDNQSRSIAALSATDYIRVKVELRNQSSCITSTQPLITGPKGEKWAPSNYLFFSEPRDYVLILPDNTPPLAICQGETEGVQVSFPVGTYQWINTNTEITWFLRRDGIVYPLYTIDLSNATQDQLAGYFTLTADELNQALSDRYPQLVPGELIDGDEVYMEYISDLDREIRSRCSQGGQVNASQVITVIVNNLEAEAEPFEEEICLGETITVQNLEITTLTGTNEVSYQWYINGQLYTQATGPTFDFTPSSATPGTYEIEVTLTNGCQTISALAIGTLTVNPLPEVTLGNLSVCVLNAPITLTTGSSNITAGSGTYSGPGITNGVFDPSAEGVVIGSNTYTYTYVTENGCEATATSTIMVTESTTLQAELNIIEDQDGTGYYWIVEAPSAANPGDLNYGNNPVFVWEENVGDGIWNEVQRGPSNVYIRRDPTASLEIRAYVINTASCILNELFMPNNPLPVEMLYFRAQKQGADAVLEWATAKEENNTGFEVQVSTDGSEYRKLAFVPTADGNTTGTQTYTYTDREKGKAGNRYYRLMQIDIDGTTEYFGPQLVQFETRDQLTFYPNPFQEEIQLDVQAEVKGPLQIRISNAAGVKVLERTLTVERGTSLQEISLDPSLPRGMYFITTQMGGVVRHFKLMKQ